MQPINQIKAHQMLHGYSNGHRLISSSVDLSNEIKRTLLILSDMSGSSMVTGFEEYFTGFPISEELFALSKTWYAPEMPRPGCVWTHTIIIEKKDFDQFTSLGDLRHLFRRPTQNDSFDDFKRPFSFVLGNSGPQTIDIAIAQSTIEALYEDSQGVVFLPSSDARQYEDLIFALWSQQWSSLRKAFSFCTGALSARKVGGSPLDLQVIPKESMRMFRKDSVSGLILDPRREVSARIYDTWITTATTALEHGPATRQLRTFFLANGASFPANRSFFPTAVSIYEVQRDLPENTFDIRTIVNQVGMKYPFPHQGTSLKKNLFGGIAISKRIFEGISSDIQILKALAESPYSDAFDPIDLTIRSRSSVVWSAAPLELKSFIISFIGHEPNRIITEILNGIIDEMLAKGLPSEIPVNDQLFLPLITQRPSLLTQPSIRNKLGKARPELWEVAIRSSSSDKAEVSKIVYSALTFKVDEIAEVVIHCLGSFGVGLILEWFDGSQLSVANFPWNWKRELERNQKGMMDWLDSNYLHIQRISTASLLSDLLDPRAVARSGLISPWHAITRLEASEISRQNLIKLTSFILAVALEAKSRDSFELIRLSFDVTYDALKNNELSYYDWRKIEPLLPRSGWLDWDKEDRLRRGVVSSFIDSNFLAKDFFEITRNPATLELLLRTLKSIVGGSQFFARIMRYSEEHWNSLTEGQKNTIRRLS